MFFVVPQSALTYPCLSRYLPDSHSELHLTLTLTSMFTLAHMTTVTVLGLGPMGHALAAAFAAGGLPTTVWNRTPGRGDDLDVTIADTVAAAAAASPLVVVCLRDYQVAQSVLDVAALRDRTVVNFSGGSPQQARAMAVWAEQQGIRYIDGVIVATPTVIGSSGAALYYSGSSDAYEAHRSTLSVLGENATYLGSAPGLAAGLDASLQDLLWTSMSGVVHMFALAGAESIAAHDVAGHAKAMLGLFPDLIDMLADQLVADRFPGDLATLTSVAATLDHLLGTLRTNDLDDKVLGVIRAQVQQEIEDGHGSDGFGRLARRS